MDNDAARDEMNNVLELVQEQMADLAALQKKQATLTATAEAAEGMVAVTVDARGVVIKTVIDEAYLEDFEFDELGEHVTAAAQDAAGEVGRRVAELVTPLNERRKMFPALGDIVEGAPDVGALLDNLVPGVAAGPGAAGSADGGEAEQPGRYPTVRR